MRVRLKCMFIYEERLGKDGTGVRYWWYKARTLHCTWQTVLNKWKCGASLFQFFQSLKLTSVKTEAVKHECQYKIIVDVNFFMTHFFEIVF